MNVKGHIATTGIFLIAFERIITKQEYFSYELYLNNFVHKNNLIPLFTLNDITLSNNVLFVYNLIFISGLILMGSAFPDMDIWFGKKMGLILSVKEKREKHNKGIKYNQFDFMDVHRQITHSPIVHISLLSYSVVTFLFHYQDLTSLQYTLISSLYYFEIGVITHLIADIFVGKGGIPLGFVRHWNSSRRIKLNLIKNKSSIDIFMLIIFFIILTRYISKFNTGINVLTISIIFVMVLIGFWFRSSFKLFFTFLSVFILNIILFYNDIFLKYISKIIG